MLDEKQLLLRVRRNDTDAFEMLYNTYFDKLLAFLKSLRLEQNSDDIIQETFIKIWEKRGELDPGKSFNAYIFAIAKNLALKDLKQAMRMKAETAAYHSLVDSSNPVDALAAGEREEELLKLIEKLPERPRTILKMKRFEGLTVEQIAEKLNISPKTVQNHINLALTTLRKNAVYSLLILPFLK